MNPGLYAAATPPGANLKSLDEIVGAAKKAAPPGWDSGGFRAPEPGTNYVIGFNYHEPTAAPEEAVSLNIAVNPYTVEVVGRRVFYHAWNPLRHCFVGFFFKLHYALLLPETGMTLVGLMAILFLVSVLTGLILWWPLDGKWRRVLTLKRRAGPVRFNHDLHQTSGFYTLPVLLVVLISGLYFNLPDPFRWLVERFSPLTPELSTAPPSTGGAVSATGIDMALARARADYPGGMLEYFSFDTGENAMFTACFRDVPELSPHVLDTRCLVLDPRSGKLLRVQDPTHGSGGDVFLQWQWPLHSGQAFGWPGRILVFVAGLACPVLFVTGLIRWLQKRRSSRFRATRSLKEALNKWIPFVVRQAQHERNQYLTVHPELVEGLIQSFLKGKGAAN